MNRPHLRTRCTRLLIVLLLIAPGILPARPGDTLRRTAPRTVPARAVSDAAPLPAAHGDWRQWRGNPQHTGFQSTPGMIQTPAIQWRYRLGGQLSQTQTLLCSEASSGADILVVAPSGHLAAYTLDGAPLWQSRPPYQLNLLGCWDFAADGHTELLAASSGTSGGQLFTFDTSDGSMLWSSAQTPGSFGEVKVMNLDAGPALELLWLPAGSSKLFAYTFASGAGRASLLWSRTIHGFVSDPYTYSSIGVTSANPGNRQIVISGARHQIPLIVLDAKSGAELGRKVYQDVGGRESGGTGQLLALKDIDGSGVEKVINIASYGSSSHYMFQGATVSDARNLTDVAVLDTGPVGLRYVRGSVADFDGDGRDEILVSQYVPEADRHDLLLLSALDLTVKAKLQDFYLLAIADLADGQGPRILGLTGVAAESPFGTETMVAYRYGSGSFSKTNWRPGSATLATLLPRAFDQASVENPGDSPVIVKTDSGGPGILMFQSGLVVTDARTGAAVARYTAPAGVGIALLAVAQAATPADSRVILSANDGSLVFLDGRLQPVATDPIGGYYQSWTLNGHSFEVAAVADLEGDGRNDIVAVDARNRVLKLASPSTPGSDPPSGQVLWDTGESQELAAIPWVDGGSRLLIRGQRNGLSTLNLLEGNGSPIWVQSLAPGDDTPIGLNFGHFQNHQQIDIAVSCGNNASFPRSTCAFDGLTGAPLWRSPEGTYWDATLAIWDFNGDGIDDVVMNYNVYKASVLDGRSGQLLNSPVVLPDYGGLESLDYNGALLVAGSRGTATAVINAEDDAHLALISVDRSSKQGSSSLQSDTSWAIPQAHPDDQRFSMPAIAPDGKGGWLVGVGSQNGTFDARRSDGSLVWSEFLWNGQVVHGDLAPQVYLSSVTAVDINGDGHAEFLVGGIDGWLYALEAETGALLWNLDLGAPVGDPIAADIDNDGFSEILVPVADGYLYAIGPKP